MMAKTKERAGTDIEAQRTSFYSISDLSLLSRAWPVLIYSLQQRKKQNTSPLPSATEFCVVAKASATPASMHISRLLNLFN
jgi:hypothetical protein